MTGESVAAAARESEQRDVAIQLRRRRSASRRCPEMPDGRRDPLDKPRPARSVEVRAVGRESVEFRGCEYGVADAIRDVGARAMKTPVRGGWLVRQDLADDVMALLEARGYGLVITL